MAKPRNYENIENQLVLDNETGLTHLAKDVAALKAMANTMQNNLKQEKGIYDDVSKLYDSNQSLVERTTKQIVDLINSPANRTCIYLFLAVLFLVFILFLLN